MDAIGFQHPELAATAVGMISDVSQRNLKTESLARQWLQRDPAAAQKWLNQTSLTAERKSQLLRSAPRR